MEQIQFPESESYILIPSLPPACCLNLSRSRPLSGACKWGGLDAMISKTSSNTEAPGISESEPRMVTKIRHGSLPSGYVCLRAGYLSC